MCPDVLCGYGGILNECSLPVGLSAVQSNLLRGDLSVIKAWVYGVYA